MLVKCIAVPKERTPKKVEVTLSRIPSQKKNTVRLNVRIAEPCLEEPEEPFVEDIFDTPIEDDNLSGIIPVSEIHDAEEAESEETFDISDIFCDEDEEASDEPVDAEDIFSAFAERADDEVSISEINADFEELENDLRNQLGEDEVEENDEPEMFRFARDEGIVQRHFVRDDSGELYESDSESAEGHEVACYDNMGKLTRACGIIRKGQPIFKEPETDDVFSRAVSDMFSDSNA